MAAPLQNISGLISTIDWNETIDALMSIERAYLNSLQERIDANNTKLTAWGSLTARLLTLQNYAAVLNRSSTFQATKATSSDESILTATVTGIPQTGTYPLKVYQLAQAHQIISQGYSDTDTTIVGTGTITIEVGKGFVDRETPLEWLNGQKGVKRGSIKITDRSGASAVIDLTGALTVQDVIEAINSASGISVTAEIDYDAGYNVGDAIKLTDTSGGSGNFKVEEVNGGSTAADLGILADVASSVIHGEDINDITWSTSLDLLNDGTGVYKGSIQITDRAGNVDVIDLSTAKTLQDVKDLIEAGPNTNVEVQINPDTNGITIHDLNASPTQDLIIEEVGGGTTAHDLGIYTTGTNGDRVGDRVIPALNTTLLKTLNGGSGVGSVAGDDFQIQQRDGTTFNVDISGAQTVQDVINLINSATGNTAVVASLDREGNGILLTDFSGGTGNLTVNSLNSSPAASDLGILKSISSNTLEGDDLNPQYIARCTKLSELNQGKGVYAGKIKITDKAANSQVIDLSGAETVGDVLDAINSASSIQVLAQINSSGNGIEIVDQSGGTGVLKVEEAGGSTARDLNILGSTDGSSIDGSFETIIEITDENSTLQGIRDAINDMDAPVKASIINDGTEVNPYHLFIASSHSGSAGRMIVDPELSGGKELEFSSVSQPQDAVLLLGEKNPLLITESSNTVDEAIAGLTLNLLSADPAKTVQVDVSADLESIKQDIINFIDSYNEIMDFINTQQSYDADTQQTGGVLFGDVNLMNIRNDLRNSVADPIEGSGSITSIFQIGVNVDLTGKLVLDESKLDEVLNNDLEGVKNLFAASSNVALDSFGGTAHASSEYSSDFNVESVNNGNTSSDSWGSPGGGWNDGTRGVFPDYLWINFDKLRNLTKVKIYTLDSATYPASQYGIKDYELQYLIPGGNPNNDGDWKTYTTVTDNTEGIITHYLGNIVTQGIRLKINDSNDGRYSRVIELEAYEETGIAGRVKNYLSSITDATEGLIAYIEDSIQNQNEDYQNRIEAQEKLLEIKEEILRRQFTQMEEYLAQMQSQSAWLAMQISSLYSSSSAG